MIFASLGYSYEQHYQVMQRIHRIGQGESCTYHYLVSPDTIDAQILECLTKKKSMNTDIIEGFRRPVH